MPRQFCIMFESMSAVCVRAADAGLANSAVVGRGADCQLTCSVGRLTGGFHLSPRCKTDIMRAEIIFFIVV